MKAELVIWDGYSTMSAPPARLVLCFHCGGVIKDSRLRKGAPRPDACYGGCTPLDTEGFRLNSGSLRARIAALADLQASSEFQNQDYQEQRLRVVLTLNATNQPPVLSVKERQARDRAIARQQTHREADEQARQRAIERERLAELAKIEENKQIEIQLAALGPDADGLQEGEPCRFAVYHVHSRDGEASGLDAIEQLAGGILALCGDGSAEAIARIRDAAHLETFLSALRLRSRRDNMECDEVAILDTRTCRIATRQLV